MRYFHCTVIILTFLVLGCHNNNMIIQRSIDHQYKYSNDVDIYYNVEGVGAKKIVFLHGFGASSNSWDDIKDNFPKDKYSLYLIDLKGFGLSSKPKDDLYTIKEHVRIIIGFLKKMELEDVILVGHSYGGGIALMTQLELLHNNESHIVDRMILIDCAAYLDDIPFFIKMLQGFFLSKIVMPILSSNYKANYTLKKLYHDESKITKKKIQRYATAYTTSNSMYAMRKAAKQIIPNDYDSIINSYSNINTPTLIIWGKNDPALSIELGLRLNKVLPNSILEIVKDCGHIPQEECPNETYKLIESFLKSGM